ncbi:MAG: NTP transferase domain-containing protein [Akkermansiaceae bacterium]|jgi:choline kinase|nr:NTP transferase domain-containing protein [Akkermansiaceae bacterium]
MKPTLLVLAAGMGSRYGGLKQMDPMGPNGETVLDYSVFDAIRAGFGKVVFVIREDFAEAFKEGVGSRFADRIEVAYAFQKLTDLPEGFSVPEGREKPWGTAHAVRAARHVIDGPFAVVNADDFYGADAYQVIAAWFAQHQGNDGKEHYAMVGYPLRNTLSEHGSVNRGICQKDAANLLTDVEEVVEISRGSDGIVRGTGIDGTLREIADTCPVSMNFWGFTPAWLIQLEEHFIEFLTQRGGEMKSECYIPTVVDDLIRKGAADCEVLDTTANWFGVTYPDDKPHVVSSIQALVESGEYPSPLH